jgi:hypothetical protein
VVCYVRGLEVLVLLVFWYFLPNHLINLLLVGGVNFVVMSSCEMPSYDVGYLSSLLMFRIRTFLIIECVTICSV